MNISVIGSGAWGTALSMVCARANNNVNLITRNLEVSQSINNFSTHPNLNNLSLLANIKSTTDYKTALESDLIFIVLPAQNVREVFERLAKFALFDKQNIIVCSKGIEKNTLKLLSQVAEEFISSKQIAILSGPNFAKEIIDDLPAITTISSFNPNLTNNISKKIKSENFLPIVSDDPIGTQIYGACKNIIAIATGIAKDQQWGENFLSALLTISINEVNQLNLSLGGKTETFLTGAGFGDINLTCNSPTSRNTSLGIAISKKMPISSDILTEGFHTAESAYFLAQKNGLSLKIISAIYKILYQKKNIELLKEAVLQ